MKYTLIMVFSSPTPASSSPHPLPHLDPHPFVSIFSSHLFLLCYFVIKPTQGTPEPVDQGPFRMEMLYF